MILARTNDDIQWAKRIGQPLDLSPVPEADLLRELERRQAKIQATLQASLAGGAGAGTLQRAGPQEAGEAKSAPRRSGEAPQTEVRTAGGSPRTPPGRNGMFAGRGFG